MVFKEGWVDKAIDLVSVFFLVGAVFGVVAFLITKPGVWMYLMFSTMAAAGLFMGIRGLCVITDWLDK